MPQNLHLALPNQKLLGDVLTNWSAHDICVIDLTVGVRAGRHPCAEVRNVLEQAVDAYIESLPEHLFDAGIERSLASSLPRPKVFGPTNLDPDKGMQWLVKIKVPEKAMLRAKTLGYGCVHDALLDRGVAIFEKGAILDPPRDV